MFKRFQGPCYGAEDGSGGGGSPAPVVATAAPAAAEEKPAAAPAAPAAAAPAAAEEKPAAAAAPAGSLLGAAVAASKDGTDGKPAEEKPKDGEEEKPKDGEEEKPAGLKAEDIAFDVPEGFAYDEAKGNEFKGILADPELGLDAEKANKLAGKLTALHVQAIQRQNEQWAAIQAGWVKSTNEDPEVGGTGHKIAMASAVKALDTFGTPALVELLDTYGIGNNPEMIRFFKRVGEATGEDKVVQAGGGGSRSAADVLYG